MYICFNTLKTQEGYGWRIQGKVTIEQANQKNGKKDVDGMNERDINRVY